MAFYSFKVKSPDVLPVPGQLLALDTGINVFSAEVPDVDIFVAELVAIGVVVLEKHQLDNLEPVEALDILLPAEREALLALPNAEQALAGVLSGYGSTGSQEPPDLGAQDQSAPMPLLDLGAGSSIRVDVPPRRDR